MTDLIFQRFIQCLTWWNSAGERICRCKYQSLHKIVGVFWFIWYGENVCGKGFIVGIKGDIDGGISEIHGFSTKCVEYKYWYCRKMRSESVETSNDEEVEYLLETELLMVGTGAVESAGVNVERPGYSWRSWGTIKGSFNCIKVF